MAMPDRVETRPLLKLAVTRAERVLAGVVAVSKQEQDAAEWRENLAAARTLLALADAEWERQARTWPAESA